MASLCIEVEKLSDGCFSLQYASKRTDNTHDHFLQRNYLAEGRVKTNSPARAQHLRWLGIEAHLGVEEPVGHGIRWTHMNDVVGKLSSGGNIIFEMNYLCLL